MNEKDNNIVLAEMDNMEKSLCFVRDVADKLEKMEDDNGNIDRLQYIESIRDNIEIVLSQFGTLKEKITEIAKNPLLVNNISFEAFTMKDTRVLIVDDNEINNCVVEQMLSRFDIEVDTASSGEEAICMFKENDYDMILMDYLMPPGIDGIETVRRIRECGEKGEKQLIIGLTANDSYVFKRGLNKYNVELILMKPVKYQQMSLILQKEIPAKVNFKIL